MVIRQEGKGEPRLEALKRRRPRSGWVGWAMRYRRYPLKDPDSKWGIRERRPGSNLERE